MRGLFFCLAYFIFLIRAVFTDLPSCIRAKCSHCKVPFIAQMCPIACSGCPVTAQNHLTSDKEARGSAEIANRAFHSRIKVPFAQQIPSVDSNGVRENFHTVEKNKIPLSQPQLLLHQQINNFQQQQNRAWQRNEGQLGQQFTGQITNNQYRNEQPQQRVEYPQTFPQEIQQTTNFGGSYGHAVGFLPMQQNIQGPSFNHPFQPFLQQSFQSQMQSGFTPSIIASVTQQTPKFQQFRDIQRQPNEQQHYFGQGQVQQNGQFSTFNQNIPTQSQQFIQQAMEKQQLQQNRFISPGQPILHAVPNAVDPLQRTRQLQSIHESQEKWIDQTAIYKEIAANDEIKRPGSIISDRNNLLQKCPKSNWEPCVPKDVANQRFQNCCSRLGDGCSQLCSYDQNLTTIQLAVLTGRCTINKVADMMICASGYEDATVCCQAFGVFEPGFEHCRPYCNPSGGLPNDGMLAEKYRCLQKLQQIQRCFYLTQRP